MVVINLRDGSGLELELRSIFSISVDTSLLLQVSQVNIMDDEERKTNSQPLLVHWGYRVGSSGMPSQLRFEHDQKTFHTL